MAVYASAVSCRPIAARASRFVETAGGPAHVPLLVEDSRERTTKYQTIPEAQSQPQTDLVHSLRK